MSFYWHCLCSFSDVSSAQRTRRPSHLVRKVFRSWGIFCRCQKISLGECLPSGGKLGVRCVELLLNSSLGINRKPGNIVYLRILGQPIIIINSSRVAIDLFDKMGAIYSDRPYFVMAIEMLGWGKILTLLQYNQEFRHQRKLLHGTMGTRSSLDTIAPTQELESRRFLQRVLDRPEDLLAHIRKLAPASIIQEIRHSFPFMPGLSAPRS